MAFGATSIIDNFNRANENPMTGWANMTTSGLQVVSNACTTSGAGLNSSYWNTIFTGADCEAYVTIASDPASNRSMYVYVRLTDIGSGTTDGYAIKFNKLSGTDTLQLIRVDNGSETVLGANFTQELTAGNKFGIEIVGSTLTAYVNTGSGWTSLGTRTDSTYSAAGYAGLGIASGSLDDFGGGVLSSGITVTPSPVTAVSGSLAPTIVFGSISLSGLVCASISGKNEPEAVLGAISIIADPVVAIGEKTDPTTIQGQIVLIPNSADGLSGNFDPDIVLSSIIVTPAQSTAVGLTVNPSVDSGGDVIVLPDAVFSVGQNVNPTIIYGDLVITSSAVSSVANIADPVVLESGILITPDAITAVSSRQKPNTIQGDLAISNLVSSVWGAVVNPTVDDGSELEITFETGVIYMPALYGVVYEPDTSGVVYMPASTGKVKS